MTAYEVGYTEAWFDPRNRWGGAKVHAVKPGTVRETRWGRRRYGIAMCGADVTCGAQDFVATDVQSCKRCAKKVAA